MTFGSLFSGIGGFDLGLERAGMQVKWQVEIDPYCLKVLEKHWPHVRRYTDIKTVDWSTVEPVDLICGGFPCQPVSVAGKRKGTADSRWLWPEFARCVGVLRPHYVLIENVPGLLVRGFVDVLRDLAACGYDAEWDCIPASAVGAPHQRDRVWIVAYACESGRWRGERSIFEGEETAYRGTEMADADEPRLEKRNGSIFTGRSHTTIDKCDWWAVEPNVGRVAHGVPHRVDRLKGLGNAVVPQVVTWIGERIMMAQEVLNL